MRLSAHIIINNPSFYTTSTLMFVLAPESWMYGLNFDFSLVAITTTLRCISVILGFVS